MTTLAFSRDGTVTIREHGEPDRALDPDDPLAILRFIRSSTELEDGMTVAQFMRSLKPWAAVLSELAWCDLNAWEAAICRPHLQVVAEDAPLPDNAIEAVVVRPVLHCQRPGKGNPCIFINWDTSGRLCHPTEYGSRRCSLTGSPPWQWAHVPLIIETAMDIMDDRPPVLQASPGGDKPKALETCPCFFDTIVLGFLDDISFHGDPAETEEFRTSISRQVQDLKRQLEGERQENPTE